MFSKRIFPDTYTIKNTQIKLIEEALDTTTLSDIQKKTLKSRLGSLLQEYYSRAYNYSLGFNTFRITITVGSLIIPALLSIQNTASSTPGHTMSQEVYWVVWMISLLVTMSNGIMTLLKIDKKYFTLNTTFQHLLSESWQFVHLAGAYSGSYTPTIPVSHQNQYVFFCNKIEKIRMRHIEDEYYKAAEQLHAPQEIIVPPTIRNRLPYHEFSNLQVNEDVAEIPAIRRNSAASKKLTPVLNRIIEERTDNE